MSSILLFEWIGLFLIPKIYGDTLDCTGDNACAGETIACASGEACTVNCDGNGACQRTTIQCAVGHDCNVNCINGDSGCRYANIEATHASELWLSGCGCCSYQCYSMYIYCPAQVHSIKKCHITGGGAPRNFDIFAVNGFNGVDFSEYNADCYGCGIGTYMFCEHDWISGCLIADTGWNCDESEASTICDNPPIPAESQTSAGLSAGTIFIIIILSAFVGYCLIGYGYNYKSKQKQNQNVNCDQLNIPNYNMWKTLPMMVFVGCKVSYEWLRNRRSNNDEKLLTTTEFHQSL